MHSFRGLWEYLHDDPQPTANLDSTRTREQPELSPSLCGTENKELNPSNSGGSSLIWTALGLARPSSTSTREQTPHFARTGGASSAPTKNCRTTRDSMWITRFGTAWSSRIRDGRGLRRK